MGLNFWLCVWSVIQPRVLWGSRSSSGFWWGRRLLPDFQGVGLASGVQVAGLASGSRMLAWPLMGLEASIRSVGWHTVLKRGGTAGVRLGKHGRGGGGLTWSSGCWPGLWRSRSLLSEV